MRFLIDMPVTPMLADWLIARGHSAEHASRIGHADSEDTVLLDLARERNAVLITADLDFPRLLALSGATSPSVILFRGGEYANVEMIRLVERVLIAIPPEELSDSFVVVDRDRIRRRILPLV